MKVKEEREKTGLKPDIRKAKIMASRCITSWQIYGETMERVTGFIFQASQSLQMVTEAMKLKDALGRKGITNLDSILKTRDITNKGLSSQTYGFFSNHV